jgi:hypothetical protein
VHPTLLKGLSLGLSFEFCECLGSEFEFEYFANLEKNEFFEYGFEYQF